MECPKGDGDVFKYTDPKVRWFHCPTHEGHCTEGSTAVIKCIESTTVKDSKGNEKLVEVFLVHNNHQLTCGQGNDGRLQWHGARCARKY